jgi:hypothetical protein
MRIIAWLIYVVTELVFYEHVPQPRYWKRIARDAFAYQPSESEQEWQKKFLEALHVENP